jgi:hypothetical protein
MRLADIARAVRDGEDGLDLLVAEWTGRALASAVHIHADRVRYRGLLVPRCAKRAVLFLAARVVGLARQTHGRVIVAGHGDGGVVAALAAECARVELAFDETRRVVRSVSFGAPMRYPVHADVCVVSTRDARALYPARGILIVGPRDFSFYASMALAMISSRTNEPSVSAAGYVSVVSVVEPNADAERAPSLVEPSRPNADAERPPSLVEPSRPVVIVVSHDDHLQDVWVVVPEEE